MTTLLLPYDFSPNLKLLSDEEAGILFKAIFRYEINGDIPGFEDRVMTMCFNIIKNFLDSNRTKYEEICQRRSAAAKKRWKESQTDTNECKSIKVNAYAGNTNINTNTYSNDNTNSDINVNSDSYVNDSSYFNVDSDVSADNEKNDFSHTHKTPHGEFKNVFLSEEEYTKLKQRAADANKRIDSLSAYMKSSGKTYEDHYAQLLNWQIFAKNTPEVKQKTKKPPGERREPTFDVSEFTKKALNLKYVPPTDE